MMEKYNKMGNNFTWQMKKEGTEIVCFSKNHQYMISFPHPHRHPLIRGWVAGGAAQAGGPQTSLSRATLKWFHFDSNNIFLGIGIHYYLFYFLLFSSNKPIKNKETLCLLHFGHFALPRDTEDSSSCHLSALLREMSKPSAMTAKI